ncbi:ATP-binding protein [Bacteroides hominis (ex Liu et al. 2022)]|uniref:sensor histidine kinase n=1 Tax=Bacteroides hominis TaxID=2763023 RepID=UPI00294A1823|nr:ATP-binding protein [Bacteroides hominis (ex Liu et al. 2022)]MDV6142754.1 ATP-binding protein [Bacteroides hominis (ex Liu et al. 2022)]
MKRSRILYIAVIGLILILAAGWAYSVQSHQTEQMEKNIQLVYSFGLNDIGYGKFRQNLEEELKAKGITPRITEFYLNCEFYNEQEEVERMRGYLDSVGDESVDMLLVVGDQAAYSVLKSAHPLLRKRPVVLSNIHFPNEEQLRQYEDAPVYLLSDRPDFKTNIEFMKRLFGRNNITVVYNLDLTFLGKCSMKRLLEEEDKKNIVIWGRQKGIFDSNIYQTLYGLAQKENLAIMDRFSRNEDTKDFTIKMFPFRYMAGLSLLVITGMPEERQHDTAFLLDKWDVSTMPVSRVLNIPSFSCIREGFNENIGIVGGYMATDAISAGAVALLAEELWVGNGVKGPKRRELAKEYILDWTPFSAFKVFDVANVPENVKILNRPFYDKYRREIYVSGAVFVCLFIVLFIALLRIRRKVRCEHEDIQALKSAHEHLSLSTSGGNISLWYIRRGELNLDENFVQLTGIKCRRYAFRQFLKYLHPDDMQCIEKLFRETKELQVMALQRLRFCFDEAKGYEWFECRCDSLKDNQGELVIAGVIQNVQELVRREDELIRAKEIAENAELKQSFLANMSHEIRTPLNAIVGFTNILVDETAGELDEEEKKDMIGIVNHNSELLLKLISDVLDISRLDSNNQEFVIERYDLAKIVSEIYRTHQVIIHPPVEFRLKMDDSWTVYVAVDKLRLIQVISNFLSNANKFTVEGSITLGCEVDPGRAEVGIYVEDTGKGIDTGHLNAIFDRFYKADEFAQGTGLGLSICKVIATRLSGRVEVQSQVGKGSRFTLVLPLIRNSEG